MDIPRLAAFYREALLCDLITVDELVGWADCLINNGGELPAKIYDLSLGGSRGKLHVADLLNGMAVGQNPQDVVPAILDVVHQRFSSGEIDLAAVVAAIRHIKHAIPPNEDLHLKLVTLEEDYWLAADGIMGDLPTIHRIVRDLLTQFRGASTEYLDRAA